MTLAGRILHAVGLSRAVGISFGRFWGLVLHWSAMVGAAGLGVWQGLAAL